MFFVFHIGSVENIKIVCVRRFVGVSKGVINGEGGGVEKISGEMRVGS